MDNKIKEFLKPTYLLILSICYTGSLSAAPLQDTSSISLENVDIVADKVDTKFRISTKGEIVLNKELFKTMPKVLGNADPVRIIQFLPRIRTNSETEGGISIQGAEPQHTGILMDGVPVYGAAHLMGIFSLFNPFHFSEFSLKYNTFSANASNFIGGEFNVSTDSDTNQNRILSADAEVGLISSQASLRIKANDKTKIILSARTSYLNLLYGNLISNNGYRLTYNFSDYNFTLLSKPTTNDFIRVAAYFGNDNCSFDYVNYGGNLKLNWQNMLGQVYHRHTFDRFILSNNVYCTEYNSVGKETNTDLLYKIDSRTRELGYNLNFDFNFLTAGLRIQHFMIQPQRVYSYSGNSKNTPNSASTFYSLYAEYKHYFNTHWELHGALKGGMFVCNKIYFNLDPSITLSYSNNTIGKIELGLGRQTQPLSKVSLSNIGMNYDFYLSPSDINRAPQYAVGADLTYTKSFLNDALALELCGFCKKLLGQVEYRGNMFEILQDQNPDNYLLYGHGYSFGGSIMIQKNKGKFNGWISYCFTRSRRTFSNNGYNEYYPASGERPHELNIVATYRFNRNWDIGACFVYASGAPFTSIKQIYLINGKAVPELNKHNSDRMDSYMRLDLSANYHFNTKGNFKHGLSFSLYDATRHPNPMYIHFRAGSNKGDIPTMHVTYDLIYFRHIIPSLSYFINF